MSDRIKGLTVTLDRDYQEEDAVSIVEAIRMVRGVVSVETHNVEPMDFINRARIKHEIEGRILQALVDDPDRKPVASEGRRNWITGLG